MQLDLPAASASGGRPEQQSSPASPSHSWSSTETVPLQSDLADSSSDPEQKRPKRCKITREQLAVLVKTFDEEPLPNFDQRQSLAKMLGMTPRSVQIWFQNRRQRLKPATPKARDDEPASSGQPWGHDRLAHPRSQQPPLPGMGGHQQQGHYGPPGYSAPPNLCPPGMYPSAYDMWQMQQMHHNRAPGNIGSFNLGDMMEPFAATKALLGAGYHPSSLLLRQLSGGAAEGGAAARPPAAEQGSSSEAVSAVSAASAVAASADPASQTASPVTCGGGSASDGDTSASDECANKAPEAANGLLMLLACAGGGT